MKKIFTFTSLWMWVIMGFSQTLKVVDKITSQPLPGCTIYSQDQKISTTTDAKGRADISPFQNVDSISFRYISYESIIHSYKQLEAMQFIVEMEESKISLNEVVISASRWEQEQIDVPNRIEKISTKEIAFQNPQTAADLLGSGGYAYIQKSQQAGGSPMLRGFSTNRIMIVVDGVRMNNAIFRSGNLQNVISLDAGSVESAEILFGPGAVMYGSDAIGGVMDFHTINPQLSTNGKTIYTGNSFARFSSANKEKTCHFNFDTGLKKLAFATSITYSDYDDLLTGSKGNSYFLRPNYQETINGVDTQFVNRNARMQVHSGYNQYNLLQKIRFKPNEAWDFDYAIHYSATSDAPRYDRLTLDANGDDLLDNAEWYYGPQKWMMNRLGVQYKKNMVLFENLRIVAALQNSEESRHDRRMNNSRIRHQIETVDAYSFNLDLDKRIGEKINLFYGAEMVYNIIGSTATREHITTGVITPTNTRYPDGSTWQSYATYVNMKYNFKPKWTFNAGLRYSHILIDATFDTTFFDFPFTTAHNRNGALNGSLGMVFKASETWQLYANGSTGFRAPNIDDMGKVFESEPGSVIVPNPNLKPEYAYSAELGTAKTFGEYVKLDFSTYYTFLDNALARRNFTFNGEDSIVYEGQMSQVQAIQNITQAYIYGVQAGIDFSFTRRIKLSSIISYQHGEEQSEDSLKYYPLRHAPPLFGSTHLVYERKKFKFDLYGLYNAKMDYEDLALSERADNEPYAKDVNGLPFVPGWYTLNFKAAWFINKNLVLNAGVENMTDQLYRPYASGISAPGRNFIVALRARF